MLSFSIAVYNPRSTLLMRIVFPVAVKKTYLDVRCRTFALSFNTSRARAFNGSVSMLLFFCSRIVMVFRNKSTSGHWRCRTSR
jgi:hypothetical protein